MESSVCQKEWYDEESTFAQTSATTTAATSTPALPDSVCRNERSGAERPRCHKVMPRHDAEEDVSAIAHHAASVLTCGRRDPRFRSPTRLQP